MLPLIDIVFLLLVFFIYAMLSMAVHRGMPVQLPAADTAAVDPGDHTSISIDRSGVVHVDRQRVDADRLPSALAALTTGRQEAKVLLFADRRVPYEAVFDLLDRIRSAGIRQVSLQAATDPEP